jgi:hypothetical protein
MFFRLALILTVASTILAAQDMTQGFVIDTTKPYAYLKFDHVADRKPLSSNESPKGLWLRLVNNCRIPIIVAIFNPGTGDPGVGIYDEVVPVVIKGPFFQGLRSGESPPKLAQPSHEKPPEGYAAEVFSTTTIAPGSDLLFSVPLNHVSQFWYLQIMFNLDVPGGGYGSEPHSTLSFHWQDIPEKFRQDAHP